MARFSRALVVTLSVGLALSEQRRAKHAPTKSQPSRTRSARYAYAFRINL